MTKAAPAEFALVPPRADLRDTYLRGLAELQNEGWLWYADHDLDEIARDFGAHLRAIEAARTFHGGEIVPETELWGLVDGEVAGRITIRHELTEGLREVGGHIGYDTVPRFRGRGVASAMLAAACPIARAIGLGAVLLTCTDDNAASIRVIEKNGGVLSEKRAIMGGRLLKRYYWIDLTV